MRHPAHTRHGPAVIGKVTVVRGAPKVKARLGACRANDPCGDGLQQVLRQHLQTQTCVVGIRWQQGCLGEG